MIDTVVEGDRGEKESKERFTYPEYVLTIREIIILMESGFPLGNESYVEHCGSYPFMQWRERTIASAGNT
jgi:hypothetical protein